MVFKPQQFHDENSAMADAFPVEASLEQQVAEALAISEGLDATELTVVATGGEIFLGGWIGSRDELDRAVEIALAVPGVQTVTVQMQSPGLP
ncbi:MULTISPECIES: BON domain-containing protein [Rhizobium]|uniref:Transporter n=1 Tax=Rhizobium wuzhouense TaxID=1986026 RepID=A0ABX5NXE7_9HYPH|nr:MULTISPECIES: BON domain-containing protein [Rhizobium]PYB77556.1 transporter [Rhizobium wuzhouense]RKE86231.1 BON domain-containing protein [Rhizobium sp. AG855]